MIMPGGAAVEQQRRVAKSGAVGEQRAVRERFTQGIGTTGTAHIGGDRTGRNTTQAKTAGAGAGREGPERNVAFAFVAGAFQCHQLGKGARPPLTLGSATPIS